MRRVASTRWCDSPALEASCLRGAFPPVDFRAVCLVRAIVDDIIWEISGVCWWLLLWLLWLLWGEDEGSGCEMQEEKSEEKAGGGIALIPVASTFQVRRLIWHARWIVRSDWWLFLCNHSLRGEKWGFDSCFPIGEKWGCWRKNNMFGCWFSIGQIFPMQPLICLERPTGFSHLP